jgi:ribosomal protein S18 acetylase RimI-like enzyme
MANSYSPSHSITVQHLEEDQLEDVITVHNKVLGYTLNSRLGPEHLRLLYSTMLKNPNCFVGVAQIDSKIVGFISGTLNIESTKSMFFRSISIGHLFRIISHFLLHPSLVVNYWHGTQIEKPVFYKGTVVEPILTTIGVDDAYQGLGIGRKLVKNLEQFFLHKGVSVYRLDTLLSNQNARKFYASLGFVEVAERADSVVFVKVLEIPYEK